MSATPFRVLLVNPPPFEVVEPWYDRPDFGRQGLACLAGYLRAQEGFDVRIIDAKLERLDFAELLRRILAFSPHVVGLTAFTNEIKPAAHVATLLKQQAPHVTTLIGGVHASALPERTLREFPAFDYGCIGEGELTLHELCRVLRDGGDLNAVQGIVYRLDGEIRRTPERPKVDDLDRLPPPAWDLLPPAKEYWVMTQRGCPFTCKFCVNPNGRVPRQHSIGRVLSELQLLVDQYHPKKIWFADEIFTVDMPRTHQLAQAMIDAGLGTRTRWWAETHVHFVDEALCRQLKRAGCEQLALGIESGDESALRRLGKGTTVPMIVEAFQAAQRAGLETIGFFILGHPNETVESIRHTVELAVRINPSIPIFGVMVPYPGTETARLAARGEGGYRLLTDDWDAYNKQLGAALEFAHLSRSQLESQQLRAYIEVFLRNGRLRDLARIGWQYKAAGLRVLRKIVSGRLKPATTAPPVAGISEETRQDFIRAAETWSGIQAEHVRQLRSLNVPGRLRVVPRSGTGT